MKTAVGADEPERIPGTVDFGWAFGQPYPITAAAPAVPWLSETRQDTVPLTQTSVSHEWFRNTYFTINPEGRAA